MKNLDTIGEELFAKIRGRFPEVTVGNEAGEVVSDPKQARFFDFNFLKDAENTGRVSVSISEKDGLTVIYSNEFITNEDSITQQKWYDFLKELRFFAKKRLLNFDTRDITKSNLDRRDYKFLAQNRAGDEQMNESKLYGTSQTSYQDMDGARLIIKHTRPVDTERAAGRTQHVGSIYIESAEGERFKYPYKHLNGARAMARHVAEGGNAYDEFGKHIVGLSEEMGKLRKFKNYMGRSAVMAESLAGYMDIVKERIGTVKKTIERLQKPNYYREAFDNFETPVFEEVPDEVRENWIDELTIRQFNEELKDVFPYIYKLVGEATRAKELGPEDLEEYEKKKGVDGKACWKGYRYAGKEKKSDGSYKDKCVKVEDEYEGSLDKLMGQFGKKGSQVLDKIADASDPGDEIEKLLRADGPEGDFVRRQFGITAGENGLQGDDDYEEVIQLMLKDMGVDENNHKSDKKSPKKSDLPLSEFILSYYDRQTGKFPKGETAVLTSIEKDYGDRFIEPAKQFIERINQTYQKLMDDSLNWEDYFDNDREAGGEYDDEERDSWDDDDDIGYIDSTDAMSHLAGNDPDNYGAEIDFDDLEKPDSSYHSDTSREYRKKKSSRDAGQLADLQKLAGL